MRRRWLHRANRTHRPRGESNASPQGRIERIAPDRVRAAEFDAEARGWSHALFCSSVAAGKMVTGNEVSAVGLSRVPREILACGNSKPVTTFPAVEGI